MPVTVQTTPAAESDFWSCYDYIAERHREGAHRWSEAFYDALQSLERERAFGLAPENSLVDEEIRQRIFKTKQGLPYRLLFIVRDETIYIIHVRGPGQDLMRAGEIELPSRS